MMLRTIISFCCFVAMGCAICCTLILAGATDHVIEYNAQLLSNHAQSVGTISNQTLILKSQSRQFDILNNEKQGILNRARDMRVELLDLRAAIKSANKTIAYLTEQVIVYERKIEELEKEN